MKWFPPAKARKTCKRLTGIGKYLYLFGEKENEEGEEKRESMSLGEEKDTDEDASDVDVNDDGEIIEIDEETKRKRKRGEGKIRAVAGKDEKKLEKGKKMLKEALKAWDPHKDEKATGDPYATLFVARLPYAACEDEDVLRREFERYGDIKAIRIVRDTDTGKPTGYAFIEFETEDDMKRAFARADGTRIEGKRVIVDAERGRTTPNWRPMRLGGGLGGYTKQLSKKEIRMKAMGNQSRRGGGGGGGGGGGFRGGPGGPGGGGGGGGGRGGRAGFGDDRTCHVCGQTGHFARECPDRREMNRGRGRFGGGGGGGRGGDDTRDRGDLPPPPSRGDRGGIGFSGGRDDTRERSPGAAPAPRFGTGMIMDDDRDRGGDRFGGGGGGRDGRDDRRPPRYGDDFDRDRRGGGRDRKRGRSAPALDLDLAARPREEEADTTTITTAKEAQTAADPIAETTTTLIAAAETPEAGETAAAAAATVARARPRRTTETLSTNHRHLRRLAEDDEAIAARPRHLRPKKKARKKANFRKERDQKPFNNDTHESVLRISLFVER